MLVAHHPFTPSILTALAAIVFALIPTSSQASSDKHLTDHLSPLNVILFIGDGMDEHQITMARNYLYGPNTLFAMEQMPTRSSVKVQTLREDNPKLFRHVADSANTASTLATGMLTSKGRISTAAASNQIQPTILEDAQLEGYRTGLVSTASLTDATTAAFASHSPHRDCESPKDMDAEHPFIPLTQQCIQNQKKRGGSGSITKQLSTANVDVLLGGGKKYFNQQTNGKTSLEIAQGQGYVLLKNTTDLLSAPDHHKLLGLFAKKHLPVEWEGNNNYRARQLTVNADGDAIYPAPFTCVPNA